MADMEVQKIKVIEPEDDVQAVASASVMIHLGHGKNTTEVLILKSLFGPIVQFRANNLGSSNGIVQASFAGETDEIITLFETVVDALKATYQAAA